VLRPFLGVGLELGGEHRVGLRCGSARSGAGDWAQGDFFILYPNQNLGRAAHDVQVVALEEIEIRARD
jgi:hypothetical protein